MMDVMDGEEIYEPLFSYENYQWLKDALANMSSPTHGLTNLAKLTFVLFFRRTVYILPYCPCVSCLTYVSIAYR